MNESTPQTNSQPTRQPKGLYTLFFTEMWERFSYYGMRALLVLFMVDEVMNGGLGLTDGDATAIYGLYTAGVYLAAVPGGWAADRLLGARSAVWFGGLIIAAGHFTLAIPQTQTFFVGLILIIVGTGLLKPNISVMVGQLYPEGGARRDAGFTIFYLGINLGAAIGPLICSTLGEKANWHYGFAAAGVGMLFGLIQYRLSFRKLDDIGLIPERSIDSPDSGIKRDWILFYLGITTIATIAFLGLSGIIRFDPIALSKWATYVIVGISIIYFVGLYGFAKLNQEERKRVAAIIILFLASAMFWSGFEQAGSSLNLFALRHTDRVIEYFDWEFPVGWFQFFNPAFIIIFAPMFATLWVVLARRNLNPSIPVKFALGFALLGLGFLVMVFASKLLDGDNGKVLPTWLITTYFLHTIGEICLSPVGLSAVTKLAPKRLVGQMMGIWFLGASLGNVIAGLIAGEFSAEAVEKMPAQYLHIVLTALGTGMLLLVFSRPVNKLMAGIK